MYFVYIVCCSDDTLYTGITTDVTRRVYEHNNLMLGAKYTRCRRPVRLVYCARFVDRATASKEEARIKQLSRAQKLAMIESV